MERENLLELIETGLDDLLFQYYEKIDEKGEFEIQNGDISPLQCMKLNEMIEQIADLFETLARQNRVPVGYREITENEFFALRKGNVVHIIIGDDIIQTEVTNAPFFNSDTSEPGWEVETENGFCDQYSLWVKE